MYSTNNFPVILTLLLLTSAKLSFSALVLNISDRKGKNVADLK